MDFRDTLKTASTGLKTNKARSVLTILGIVIGICAVVTAISIGQGAQEMIISQIASLGSNNIFIEPGAWSERMERGSMMQSMAEQTEIKTLKYSDAQALKRLPLVKTAVPLVYGTARVVSGNETQKITYFGTDENSDQIFDHKTIAGRNLMEKDVKSMTRVVVLGYQIRNDLFNGINPLGKTIRIKKTNFRVIGVLEEKGPQGFIDLDNSILIPLTTAQKLLLGENYLQFIAVQTWNEDSIDQAVLDIRKTLRERHDIYNPEGDPAQDDFKVMSQKDTTKIVKNVTGVFTALLASISAISLVVGGVGIMNIMLVSVTERTREIGLRKAVGAKRKDILNQFLLEAIILTVIGGIIGIILGSLFSYSASLVFGYLLGSPWEFSLPFNAFLLGLGVSFFVGLVFGLYPAQKASQLSPIEALRYE